MFTRKLLYGAAYYPEHWDRKLWARDVRLMKEAGFNVVRMGEFAWCYFEPEEGRFDFQWLDDALELLAGAGIAAILGTPTATIPAWMAQKYPDVMMADRNGHRAPFGIRKDYCYSSYHFERLALRMVEQLARHYGRDKRVLGFQTDNEFGSSRCRCELCRARFRKFLRQRHGTIEALNSAWGLWFWGTRYNAFEQIDWPPEWPNPSHALDARRFWSQVDIDHQARQIALLRRLAPAKLVTHNLMGLFNQIEYYQFCRELDFVSWDNYPDTETGQTFHRAALANLVMWSMRNANVMVMEQQSGATGWDTYRPPAAPGEMAMLAWQCVARGADGISYFRWRTSVSGVEQYWHGILNHDNQPRRRYREAAEMGRQMARLSRHVIGTRPVMQVGVYNNYDQIWAMQIQKQNRETPLLFEQVMQDMAQALCRLGADFGAFGDGDDLGRFRLLLCPPLYLSDPKLVRKLAAFVRAGGQVVLTARSGVKSLSNVNLMQPLPGPLARLAGVEVDEYAAVAKDSSFQVKLAGATIAAEKVREHLLPARGTEVVGRHVGTYMDGLPAITRRKVGKGRVWYVGTLPNAADWQTLLEIILPEAGCDLRADLPVGVEIARRRGGKKELTFLLNHTSQPKEVFLTAPARNLLTGSTVESDLVLQPFEVAILDRKA